MKKLIAILFLITFSLQAQVDTKNKNGYYLEDQLYIGVTYNTLREKPTSMNLRGFSNSVFAGYIRDIPLNKKRNFGLGLGLGYVRDTYFHDIKIVKENGIVLFKNFDDIDVYNSNKLVFHSIEIPFEFRFRDSTIDDYKFWRVYVGMKFSYVVYSKAEFNLNGVQRLSNFDEVNRMQYGLSLSAGHGTWNGFIYYGISNIFKNAKFNQTNSIDMKGLKFGLIFYIL